MYDSFGLKHYYYYSCMTLRSSLNRDVSLRFSSALIRLELALILACVREWPHAFVHGLILVWALVAYAHQYMIFRICLLLCASVNASVRGLIVELALAIISIWFLSARNTIPMRTIIWGGWVSSSSLSWLSTCLKMGKLFRALTNLLHILREVVLG